MATQRPTADVVPTSLRDLFGLRCAFRTTTRTSSDVILGDAWARRGFSRHRHRPHRPRRVAGCSPRAPTRCASRPPGSPTTTIADLSVTTIRHNPPAPCRRPLDPAARPDLEVTP